MNSFRFLSVFLFLLIIGSGCSEPESVKSGKKVKTIDLSEIINNDVKLNLSEFIDTLYYINPDVTEDKPIGQYSRVLFRNDTLVILDAFQSFFIYDSSGKYINSFNKCGRGPGEYKNISGFDLLSGKIYILDDIYNILVYDLNGNQILRSKTVHLPSYIKEAYKRIFTYTVPPFIASNDFFRFTVLDTNLKELVTFNKTYYKGMEGNISSNSTGRFYSYKDTLSYWEPVRDTIFRVTADYRIIPEYFLCAGKDAMPFDQSLKMPGQDIGLNYTTISSVFETTNFFFIGLNTSERYGKSILVRKSDFKGGNVVFNWDIIDNGFHNDFDGGYPFWPKFQTDEKLLITWFNPIAFREKFSNYYFRTIKPKYQVLADRFSNEINSTATNQNDWIMIVKFK